MSERDDLGLAETAASDPHATADATLPAPRDSAITLVIGETIAGRYLVRSFLGEGGMGAVYRATDDKLGEDVALKVVRGTTLGDALRDEVRIAQRVTHPNVCRTYDLEEAGGHHFVKMEYVAGVTLAARLTAGRLDVSDAVRIARAIADGLDAAHAKGIVHRDLKPGNVMLDGDRVVLMDFGIARHVGSGEGEVSGTIGYMAPEQLAGGAVDARADLYALGCVLYEMLTGERVFAGGNAVEIASRHASTPAPDVREHRADVPRWLASAVTGLLAKPPDDRPAGLARLRAGARSPWRIVAPLAVGALAVGTFAAWKLTRTPTWQPHIIDLPQFQENGDTPRFSPDGKQIAFPSDRGTPNVFRIYVMNSDGTNVHAVTPEGSEVGLPEWTRDGKALLYARSSMLVRLRVDSGVIETLWPGSEAHDCGDGIVFTTSLRNQIALRTPDGKQKVLVAQHPGTDALTGPRCDASGQRIVFTHGNNNGGAAASDVAVVDRAGHVVELTSDHHAIRGAAFTPDGRSVLFAAERDGHRRLYEITLADGHEHALTVDDDWDGSPDISSDGRRVVFDRDTTSSNLWIGGATAIPRRITSDRSMVAWPRPVAGTKLVLAEHAIADGTEIVAIDSSDGQRRTIVRGSSAFPSADGSLVYFRAPQGTALQAIPLAGGPVRTIAQLPGELVFGFDGPDGLYVAMPADDTHMRTIVVDRNGAMRTLDTPGVVVPAPSGGRRLAADLAQGDGKIVVRVYEAGATTPSREIAAASFGLTWLDDHRFGYCARDACAIADVTAAPGTPELQLPVPAGYMQFGTIVAPDGEHWYATPSIGNVTRHILDNFADRPWR